MSLGGVSVGTVTSVTDAVRVVSSMFWVPCNSANLSVINKQIKDFLGI